MKTEGAAGELECTLSREARLSAENLVLGLSQGKGLIWGKGFPPNTGCLVWVQEGKEPGSNSSLAF